MNGHNIRSLAKDLTVTDSFFYDGSANTSFNIEVAAGDNTTIRNNTFVQTESAENTHMILNTSTNRSDISGNTFVNNAARGEYAVNSPATAGINLLNNKLYNYKDFATGNMSAVVSNGNTVLESVNITIPTYNTTVGAIVYNNPAAPDTVITTVSELTAPATLATFNGKSITVGNGKMYPTLKDAVLHAASGDKIYLDEGLYMSDYALIANKNLAIIGLGK